MDYYTLITFEVIASEQIKFGKFFDGYHLCNSLNDFEVSVERGGSIRQQIQKLLCAQWAFNISCGSCLCTRDQISS